jgi:hypothetical protein
MKRWISVTAVLLTAGALTALAQTMPGTPSTPSTQTGTDGKVRIAHLSPDAPAVDVLIGGKKALTNVPFKTVSAYLSVPAGKATVTVVPTGKTEPKVIDGSLDVSAGKNYTIAVVGTLRTIKPLVLEDNIVAPAEGNANVRVLHASPDAPEVDVAAKGGDVLFPKIAFGSGTDYAPVKAGTVDLELRAAGTTTVALPVNGVKIEAGKSYTMIALGTFKDKKLEVVPIMDDPMAKPK